MRTIKPEPRPRGIACRRCGSKGLRVIYTRDRPGCRMRRRQCRACGARLITWERAAGS